jgi:hypothetical protein
VLVAWRGLVPVSTRPWWRKVRNILRTEIRGHGGSTAGPPPEINSRTRRPNVIEGEVETPGYVLLNTGRDANASGLGQTFQHEPQRSLRPRKCRRPAQRVALENADTKLDAIVARCSGTLLTHPVLPLGRTTQCINHTGKFDQQSVAGRFDDATPVLGDLRIDNVRPDRRRLRVPSSSDPISRE